MINKACLLLSYHLILIFMSEKKIKIIIVGLGKTAIYLIKRLLPNWEITAIDKNRERLNEARKLGVKVIEGDATSDLILREAGVEHVSFLLALTNDDEINLEISRLAKKNHKVREVIALASAEESLDRFDNIGVKVLLKTALLASHIGNLIEKHKISATCIGWGMGEIQELTILPGSKVKGKRLREIKPTDWLIGAIYRGTQFIIPHGNTILKENDKVLLIGDPKVLSDVAVMLSIGESNFPLQFGSRILIPLFNSYEMKSIIEEGIYISLNSSSQGIDFLPVVDKKRCSEDIILWAKERCEKDNISCHFFDKVDNILKGLANIFNQQGYGLLLLPQEPFRLRNVIGVHTLSFNIMKIASCPVLMSRSTYPYKRILVPFNDSFASEKALELAIDISTKTNGTISVAVVKSPEYISGKDTTQELRDSIERLKGIGDIYRKEIKEIPLVGNPVKEILKINSSFDLMIIGQTRVRQSSIFKPDIGQYLLHKSSCSVMILTREG